MNEHMLKNIFLLLSTSLDFSLVFDCFHLGTCKLSLRTSLELQCCGFYMLVLVVFVGVVKFSVNKLKTRCTSKTPNNFSLCTSF
jgi:hypothetical protein